MKKISLALFTLFVITSCSNEHSKEYISVSGKLENNKDSLITITGRTGVVKTISINNDGSFKDTLKVAKGAIYSFQTSRKKRVLIYLKNGFNINIRGNSEKFMTSFEYSGEGASNSNFILAQLEKSKKLGNPAALFALEEEAFYAKINVLEKEYDSILSSYKNLDSALVDMVTTQNKQMFAYFKNNYNSN
ncbi:MAG: TlpA family protein disulfide reductase, partial [Polaribacter sp.]|nr:TlpA family protein disulfide reductase [Polaribacter sp.]